MTSRDMSGEVELWLSLSVYCNPVIQISFPLSIVAKLPSGLSIRAYSYPSRRSYKSKPPCVSHDERYSSNCELIMVFFLLEKIKIKIKLVSKAST